MKKIYLIVLVLLVATESFYCQASIIPAPVKIEYGNSYFKINETTKIVFDHSNSELLSLAQILELNIESITRFKPAVSEVQPSENFIQLIFTNDLSHKEAYILEVNPENISIKANGGAGIFYGIQTLLQLFPLDKSNEILIPTLSILDYPRFNWRGVHLDVCRHFFPLEFIKKYIDILAFYKINTFHWHLTEDQGWRIEIRKYPKLIEVGSWRKESMGDKTPHGGFYTQDQVRELIEYAKQRYITVVPEIELPGHSLAALASYPEYSCTGGPFEVGTVWGIYKDVYCAGSEKVFEFLEGILSEIAELFPSEFIHIGGDEVPKDRWENCEKCQLKIKLENLKDEHELQSYFITRIEKFLNSKGKKIIGWDEILEGGLAPNAAVMSWRGIQGGIDAAKMKHYVVMSPGTHCYFDHYQGLSGEPKAIGGFTPLEKIYSYEPIPDALSTEEAKYIMGAQANMWTEYMNSTDHVEYMLLPRLCALSEVVWSLKESRDLENFKSRLKNHYKILMNKNYNFRIPPPINKDGEYLLHKDETVSLTSPIENSKIYYTIDGTEPNENSILYKSSIKLTKPITLKAKTILENGKSSITESVYFSFIDTTENGLFYKYFEGDWDSIPKFWEFNPIKKGKIHKLILNQLNTREDYFGLDLYGFIKIEDEGEYTFYLSSDDGSKLFINNKLVIDNDGLHGNKEVEGKVFLESGKHPFKILYFEKSGSQSLKVDIQGPKIKRKQITADMFYFE
jgi:hexosaminidase